MPGSPLDSHSSSPTELEERLAAERSGVAFLVYRDGHGRQRMAPLEAASGSLTVGRARDADVALVWDDEVSRLHARLEPAGRRWTVVDDGLSRNGTFVNDERLHGRRRLTDGDEVRFGKTVAVFRSAPASDSIVTTVPDEAPTVELSEMQRRVLVALCRPYASGSSFATPATNQQIANEVYLSVDAVKSHLRVLFAKFAIEDVPQNQKRVRLVELAFTGGQVSERDLAS